MRTNCDEAQCVGVFVVENSPIVACDVDASATGVLAVQCVIIKKRVKGFGLKEMQPFIALFAYAWLQTAVIPAK